MRKITKIILASVWFFAAAASFAFWGAGGDNGIFGYNPHTPFHPKWYVREMNHWLDDFGTRRSRGFYDDGSYPWGADAIRPQIVGAGRQNGDKK